MSYDSVYVFLLFCLVVSKGGNGVSVLISRVGQDYHPGQILASNTYSSLPSSATTIAIQTWINIPSQSFAFRRPLLRIRPSPQALPSFSIVNASYMAIELSTTTASESLTEMQLFPYPLAFDEWIFVEVVIRSGTNRSLSTKILYPDGVVRRAMQSLKGDMMIVSEEESADALMQSEQSGAPAAFAYLAIDQYPADIEQDVKRSPPNQLHSAETTSGGQIFERTRSSMDIECSRSGTAITSIDFASFGRPYGVYPNFRINADCHSNSTMETVRAACLGRFSCSLAPNVAIFGDPCPGQTKNMAVVASCSLEEQHDRQFADALSDDRDGNRQEIVQLDAASPIGLLEGVNVTMQILFDSESNSLPNAIRKFTTVFCDEFNTTDSRIINVNVRPLRYPLMVFTFTVLPPSSLYDLVPAQSLARAFSDNMQMSDSEFRLRTLLSGAPQPPVMVGIIAAKLRLCNGQYVYVETAQDPCTAVDYSSSEQLLTLSQIAIVISAALGIGVAVSIMIVVVRSRRNRITPGGSIPQPASIVVSPMPILMPTWPVDGNSPSNFSIVKTEVEERAPSRASKLSIRNFPMRIERLAAIGKATDSETDSGFISDINHLSVESGPARVVEYFTDSS